MHICTNCKYEFEGDTCPNCGTEIKKIENKEGFLLGFRSRKVWKRILSIIYIVIFALISIALIVGARYENYPVKDYVIDKLSGVLFALTFFSPYIFLSNTPIRTHLPLFKRKKFFLSLAGIAIVVTILLTANAVLCQFHTEEYSADKKDHAYIELSRQDATCEADGTIHMECSFCGYKTDQVIEKAGHAMQEVSRCEAGCEEDGYVTNRCNKCGFEQSIPLNKLGHSFSGDSVDGIIACINCGATVTPAPEEATPSATATATPAAIFTPTPTDIPTAKPTATPVATAGTNEAMVWLPDTGEKYHKKSVCGRMHSTRQVPLSEAIAMDYEPCGNCY